MEQKAALLKTDECKEERKISEEIKYGKHKR
jgi:hypothetical protein